MFENLSASLQKISDALTKRSAIKESDVDAELQNIRRALLDADVALPTVKEFIVNVRSKAIGSEVVRSVTPGQMIVKIVHDQLVALLGGEQYIDLNLLKTPPVPIILVGLQGSGKTTSAAKLANRITKFEKKSVLLASLDIYRPAAQQQLEQLGQQIQIPVLNPVLGERPIAISNRAMKTARLEGYDVVILDTAGRLHIDDALMTEIQDIITSVTPAETLLVADSMTGQDAVNIAHEFNSHTELSGIILTRVDGDSRGGAALSMRSVTKKPIKFIGTGEKINDLEVFNPSRIAGSILGLGDVVGLVEKAQSIVGEEQAEKVAKKMLKGQFTLDDMAAQLAQIKQMGSLSGLMNMLPGAKKIKKSISTADLDDRVIARQEAIIRSMTVAERKNPKIFNGSRRKRVATGSGTSVQEVNRLLKQYKTMFQMMKKAGKKGAKGLENMIGETTNGVFPPGLR